MSAERQTELTLESLSRAALLVLVRRCVADGFLKSDRVELARAVCKAEEERAERQEEVWRQMAMAAYEATRKARRISEEHHWHGPVHEAACAEAVALHAKSRDQWRILRRYQVAVDRARAIIRLEIRKMAM